MGQISIKYQMRLHDLEEDYANRRRLLDRSYESIKEGIFREAWQEMEDRTNELLLKLEESKARDNYWQLKFLH